jgi:hypothetical protein
MPRFYSAQFQRDVSVDIPGSTLGELIANLGIATTIRLIPHHPPKYFRFIDSSHGIDALVDVHISRNGEHICPKQDLDFLLEPDDIVEAGALEC